MPMAFSGFSKIQKGEETLSKNFSEGDTRGRLKTGEPQGCPRVCAQCGACAEKDGCSGLCT